MPPPLKNNLCHAACKWLKMEDLYFSFPSIAPRMRDHWCSNVFNHQLLAEATRRIYGAPTSENDLLTMEDDDPDPVGASGRAVPNNGDIPGWAQPLEPVRKLPTNVGTRIRKCVYEALEKDPPDWARKILEHSISKEVYKGNASGPTKVMACVRFVMVIARRRAERFVLA